MSPSILTSHDVFTVLKEIDQRCRQGSEQHSHGLWTAIHFRIADENLVIPLDQTKEIFPVPHQITKVPKSQPWVYGIANLRGELLPIFDLKYYLFNEPTVVKKRSRIVVLNHPDLYSGLLIDEVFGLKHFQQLQSNDITTENTLLKSYLNGSISQQNMNWNVFSFTKLTSEQRFLELTA
jgi:twitching motility protein PilI